MKSILASILATVLITAIGTLTLIADEPYPLTICIVTGDKLEKNPTVFTYQGREIRTCCNDCMDEFYKDPAGFAAKIEEAAKRAARP